MSTTYAQKQAPAQKKDAPTAASVLDASSQSEGLQRKADMANTIQCYGMTRNFKENHACPSDDRSLRETLLKRYNASTPEKKITINSVLTRNAKENLNKHDCWEDGPINNVPCREAFIPKEKIGSEIKENDINIAEDIKKVTVWINDYNEMGHIGNDSPEEGSYSVDVRTEKEYDSIKQNADADKQKVKEEKDKAQQAYDEGGWRTMTKGGKTIPVKRHD